MTERKRRATITVVLGLVVIVGFVVWTLWQNSRTTTTPARATATSVTRTTTGKSTAATTATTGKTGKTTSSATVDPETGLPWIDATALPSQGRQVLALIDKGGPYPYSQDGGTFSNAERHLPIKANGFYTEYTVKLPSSSDRGPVRIVMGGKGQWFFWTDDHYASFARIKR